MIDSGYYDDFPFASLILIDAGSEEKDEEETTDEQSSSEEDK